MLWAWRCVLKVWVLGVATKWWVYRGAYRTHVEPQNGSKIRSQWRAASPFFYSSLSRLTTPYSREAWFVLIGYWKSPHWPQRSEMFDSRVTRLCSRAGTVFMPPVRQCVNQSWRASSGPCYYCERLWGRKVRSSFHHCWQSMIYSSTVPQCFPPRGEFLCAPHKQTLPLFYPPGLSSRDFPFKSIEMFQSRRGPIEHGCASPHSVPNLRMGMPCAVSCSPVLMRCSGGLEGPHQSTHKKPWLAFPSGIQVCLHASEGGGHCFLTSGILRLLLYSYRRMGGMRCGRLEARAISVAGDPLMQTPDSLCIHYSQSVSTQ